MEFLIENDALSLNKFNKCGELYRSILLNDKEYMFLSCVYCKAICWDLENFLKHLDNTHHTCLNLYKEDVESQECLKKAKTAMETEAGHNSLPGKSCGTSDPLDGNNYGLTYLLPESLKTELCDSNVSDCDINIKTEIEIIRNNVNDYDEVHDINFSDYDDDDSSDDYEPYKDAIDDNMEIKTTEYYKDDESIENDQVKKNNINLKNLTKNRKLIKEVIKAYQQENILWDGNKNCSTIAKNESFSRILKSINEQFNISVNLQQIKHIIKYLKFRFMKHLRLKDKGDTSSKNLWFFELFTFLEPHLKETKMKTGICTKLNDSQFRVLTKLLKENECFWNENNIYHTSILKKQEILKQITNDFAKSCHLKDFNINNMQSNIDEVILMAREENTYKRQHLEKNDKKNDKYQSSNKFYKEIEFLLPHVGPFQCKYCTKIFGDVYTYKFHTSKHEGTKPFKCMQCSRELTHKKEFICHLRRHTKECPFQCNTCDKSFPSQKEWHRHVVKHGSKPYVCELCADSFYTQHQLTNHMKNHNNIRDHVCPECGKGFTHRGLLRQHLQTHNKTKCFCSLCDNIYSNPRSLRKHYIRVHESGQQPTNASLAQYNCQICKITFSTIQDAKQHRKEHKQSNPIERKHVCDICGHHFAYPRNLADHKKTHSNIRDQVCDICGKAFTNVNLLNQHKNVHKGEKFVCKACGKDYAHYRGLCRHITKVHGTNIRDLDAKMQKQNLDSSPQ